VSAYAELFELGASARPDDLNRVMTGIRSETGRMGHLVEELLLLARLDEGRAIEHQPVELVSVAAEAIQAGVAINHNWPVRLQAAQPVEVIGDSARLRQVLDNLLANVRAHTPAGTQATVTVERLGDQAVVSVADDGPGLSDDEADHVFERFYRADQSRSRDRGGSGLGLAIVAAIVNAHHGSVRASRNSAAGATFTITLPVAASQDPQPPVATPDSGEVSPAS
jgi:two-component system OmpR family sensor kinase